jgi:predicted secreted hydrolase
MLKFKTAQLRNNQLEVDGEASGGASWQVRHLRFMISQGNVMVEDEGKVQGNSWKGKTQANGLQAGPAQAFGLAIRLDANVPPAFETVTWVMPLNITSS